MHEIAEDLVKLYSARQRTKGYAFSKDTPCRRSWRTLSPIRRRRQLTTIDEVKSDMEKPIPMDRLICGDVGFGKAMDFLFNALGNDLATDVPSMETTHLESVHATLEQVRLLQSTHVQCERLLQRWQDVHGVQCGLAPMELLGDLVDLRKEHFLGAMQIDRIASKAKAPDIEREVLFLQELLNMARNLPVQLFDGEQGRMKVIDAVQESVDTAIRREDEYLASLGDA